MHCEIKIWRDIDEYCERKGRYPWFQGTIKAADREEFQRKIKKLIDSIELGSTAKNGG